MIRAMARLRYGQAVQVGLQFGVVVIGFELSQGHDFTRVCTVL